MKLEALNSVMCPCLPCAESAATCQRVKVTNVQSTFQSLMISYLPNLVRTHPDAIFNSHSAAFTHAQLIL